MTMTPRQRCQGARYYASAVYAIAEIRLAHPVASGAAAVAGRRDAWDLAGRESGGDRCRCRPAGLRPACNWLENVANSWSSVSGGGRHHHLQRLEYIKYKHARFRARFPTAYRYARSHYWMAPVEARAGHWRVGFTKFATRMLGELVEADFPLAVGSGVAPGQEIGTVEGFKAASAVYCVMTGTFQGSNPILDVDACIVRSDPYIDGWLYAVEGEPEAESIDAHAYMELLDQTITRMQEQEHQSEERE